MAMTETDRNDRRHQIYDADKGLQNQSSERDEAVDEASIIVDGEMLGEVSCP